MAMRSKTRSDYFIEKRITKESQLKNLYNMIKQDTNILHKAHWECKTNKAIENKQMMKKKEQLQEQRKKFIDIRRKRLADFLIAEEEEFRKEIIAKHETPEQVRLKMEAKLKDLKEQRETERQELVKSLQERRFYEGADELRKNDSEAFAFACYLEQENQMLDKMKKREMEKREEEVYVKLNNYDNLKKIEKEKLQLEEKQKKVQKTYDFLDWQRKTQEGELRKAAETKMWETQKLKEQWDQDLKREEEEKEKMRQINKMVYKDIEDFNLREEKERQKRSVLEKIKDKELLNSIVEKEKALDEIDKKEKERKISEFHQNKKYLEYVMNQKKEAEAWMDKLAQIEADKQWQRTQEQWMKEEEARIQLLKQVYKEREEAVRFKKNLNEQEKSQILQERIELDNEIQKYKEACERIKEEEALRRKKHQDDLRYQMMEKEKQRQKELQDKIYEERAAKLWEIEYQKKINEQRELHLKKLEEIKRRGML